MKVNDSKVCEIGDQNRAVDRTLSTSTAVTKAIKVKNIPMTIE